MTRHRRIQSMLTAGCACLGLLCASPSFAQQDDTRNRRSDDDRREAGAHRQGQTETELPQFLQKLDLSGEQETQIKQALQQHEQKYRQTWRQFHAKHSQAVDLEAAWAAAVRDSLSEQDRRKFDQQRMQDREMSRRSGEEAAQNRDDAQQRRREARERQQSERSDSAQSEESNRQNDDAAATDSQTAGSDQDKAENREAVGLVVITTASPERFLSGIEQSDEQKQQCAKACRQYKQKLSSVWSDLHQLHHELVKIEADRIEAVEEQLTEEQLAQLRENRQEPQDSQASANTVSERSN